MRIRELLEGKQFNDLDWIRFDNDKQELAYDLSEDLVYFMNNDDDVYRRHVYPAVSRCIDYIKENKKTNHTIFKRAVEESYKEYIKKFPIRQLPESIEEKICHEVCEKMHEELCKDFSEGKYKD